MKNTTFRYWLCQLLGWGGWMVLNLSFVYFFARNFYFVGERGRLFVIVSLIQFFWFILATHLLRLILKKTSWIQASSNKIILIFIVSVLATGLLGYYGSRITTRTAKVSLSEFEKKEAKKRAAEMEKNMQLPADYYQKLAAPPVDSTVYKKVLRIKNNTGWYRDETGVWKYENIQSGKFWWDLIFSFLLVALWLLIYMVWHYLLNNRKAEVDKLQLEKTVKELELKTIKSHINPHFIFNSLNSIRALVEENPERARTAITELSNILRSSLHVEKMETVPLEKELSIVKDYLALEQMRFEERLRVNFDVQDDTLDQPIPPMMLQTLVENSIKHGINKSINGGLINVISRFKADKLEILVQNTGSIEEADAEGFGLKSTRDRLRLMYNRNYEFNISNIEGSMVQVQIIVPAH